MSMVKLEIGERESSRGRRCSCSAEEMFQDDGVELGVKSEKVRW